MTTHIILSYAISFYNFVKSNVADLKLILLYFGIKLINNNNSLIHIMINALIMINSPLVIDNHSKLNLLTSH